MVVTDFHIKYLNRIQISFHNEKQLYSPKQLVVHFIENLFFFSTMIFIGNHCLHNLSNLNAFIEGFSVFLTGVLTITKSLSFTLKKTSLFELNKKITNMSLRADKKSQSQLLKINKIINSIVQLYYFCVCLTGAYFLILPTYSFLWQSYIVKPNTTILREVPMFAQ